mmetsp:Transcript_5180/g.14870  ORF Transcript_5180/g.14870 Transcript_5180/m.14870 type:complete len:328 (-) Transcript_5180:55-1038(-)
MGGVLVCCQELPLPEADADIVWDAPAAPDCPAYGFARAMRRFEAGEVVERSACIVLLRGACRGSLLDAYCYACPADGAGSGAKAENSAFDLSLLPTGWALLFRRCQDAQANLSMDHVVEAAHCDGGGQSPPRHWLVFRCSREIAPGDELCVAEGAGAAAPLPPIFEAAAAAMRRVAGSADQPAICAVDHGSAVRRAWPPRALPSASSLHGTGAFAAREVARGEVIEEAPTLPLVFREIVGTALRDYVFLSSGPQSSGIVLLPLGLGAVYNHGGAKGNVRPHPCATRPNVWMWTARHRIRKGEEMLIDYGSEYWAAPWRTTCVVTARQ